MDIFRTGDHPLQLRAASPINRIYERRPPGPKRVDFVSLRLAALHTGGADRHAGHRKAGRVRLVGKKTLERDGWNVSFNDIPRNFRRVARREIVRNAEPCLHRIEVYAVVKGIAVRSPRLAPALGHS